LANYIAPLKEMNFVLNEVAEISRVYDQERFAESNEALIASVLQEGARFANGVLAPLNSVGDLIGSRIVDKHVRETSGFAEAYQKFIEGGWTSLPCNPAYGGMGLPESVGIAAMEMWSAANLSFALCPMLGQGAIEALQSHASDELRDIYLEKMISGEWTGTMNLTESQAGSDLASIKTKAVFKDDHYLISGTKIFITWGDHQMTENIIHLVLARVEGAPEGVRGISLFVVPKFLVKESGELGAHNDVYALSVEHKIGIHGSPTCVMSYGEQSEGAIGYLVGEENMGLSYMFTMMNHARLNVGVEGVALSDRAYQQAVSYASGRVQGKPPATENIDSEKNAPIIYHPDVKRMLMVMRSLTEGSRALCYLTAVNFDLGHGEVSEGSEAALARAELLTPIAKAWSTEVSQEVTSLGVQVHGGMGYIEETGAAQLMRDARITTIYEGTTGIQANDLIGRKVLRDGGKELARLLVDAEMTLESMSAHTELLDVSIALKSAMLELGQVTQWLLDRGADDALLAGTAAFNYMMGAGTCISGWLLAKSAMISLAKMDDDPQFYRSKITTCRFFAAHILPRSTSYLAAVKMSDDSSLMLPEDAFNH
jgi:alkylation response protein AidB-like acyl-CoA dehydrogenase